LFVFESFFPTSFKDNFSLAVALFCFGSSSFSMVGDFLPQLLFLLLFESTRRLLQRSSDAFAFASAPASTSTSTSTSIVVLNVVLFAVMSTVEAVEGVVMVAWEEDPPAMPFGVVHAATLLF